MKLLIVAALILLSASAWGDTTTVFSGASCTDTRITSTAPTTNYGSADPINIYWNSTFSSYSFGLYKWDITYGDTIDVGATIKSCTLLCVQVGVAVSLPFYAQRIGKSWVELEATYNIWSTGNDWGTTGCWNIGSDSCGAIDNSGDGTGVDRTGTTSEGSIVSNVLTIVIDTCHLNDWFRGDDANNGLLVWHEDIFSGRDFLSTDNGTAANRPKLVVVWTGPGGVTAPPKTVQSKVGPRKRQGKSGQSLRQGP